MHYYCIFWYVSSQPDLDRSLCLYFVYTWYMIPPFLRGWGFELKSSHRLTHPRTTAIFSPLQQYCPSGGCHNLAFHDVTTTTATILRIVRGELLAIYRCRCAVPHPSMTCFCVSLPWVGSEQGGEDSWGLREIKRGVGVPPSFEG